MNLQYLVLNQQLLHILNIFEFGFRIFECIELEPAAYQHAFKQTLSQMKLGDDFSMKYLLCKYLNRVGQTHKLKCMMKRKLKSLNGLTSSGSLNLTKMDINVVPNLIRKSSAPSVLDITNSLSHADSGILLSF